MEGDRNTVASSLSPRVPFFKYSSIFLYCRISTHLSFSYCYKILFLIML